MGLIIKSGTIKITEHPNIQVLGTDALGQLVERYSSDFKGDPGTPAAEIISAMFAGDDMVFTKDDNTSFNIVGAKTTLKGNDGVDGRSIVSIEKTSTIGLVDTYTITFNDDTTITFDITNGTDGNGDVNGPATNNADYIPLWDCANSKLLKNGIPTTTFAAALGENDNYVTDAEKAALHSHSNKTALDAVTGVNTGDQDLSGLISKSIGTTEGDIIIFSASGTPIRLAKGDANQILAIKADGTRPEWRTQAPGADILQMQIFS